MDWELVGPLVGFRNTRSTKQRSKCTRRKPLWGTSASTTYYIVHLDHFEHNDGFDTVYWLYAWLALFSRAPHSHSNYSWSSVEQTVRLVCIHTAASNTVSDYLDKYVHSHCKISTFAMACSTSRFIFLLHFGFLHWIKHRMIGQPQSLLAYTQQLHCNLNKIELFSLSRLSGRDRLGAKKAYMVQAKAASPPIKPIHLSILVCPYKNVHVTI